MFRAKLKGWIEGSVLSHPPPKRCLLVRFTASATLSVSLEDYLWSQLYLVAEL